MRRCAQHDVHHTDRVAMAGETLAARSAGGIVATRPLSQRITMPTPTRYHGIFVSVSWLTRKKFSAYVAMMPRTRPIVVTIQFSARKCLRSEERRVGKEC